MPKGGHFAAFEDPELVVNDIRNFVTKILHDEEKMNMAESYTPKMRQLNQF
jgi:hypothetical protein